ncbi:inner-membrane translocator [Lelliottia amnigena]|nr:inner-membrane translocator [Lelliottia amnigena]
MSVMRMFVAIVWLAGLLPGMAQASDADTFVAASRSQQTTLLEQWAVSPDSSRLPLLQALQKENLFVDTQKHAFTRVKGQLSALGESAQAEGEPKAVRLTNRLRNLSSTALATHQLVSDNVTERLNAAIQLQRDATPAMLNLLQQRLQAEQDDKVRAALEAALANLLLASPQAEVRLQAVALLGHSTDPETQARLTPFTQTQTEPDARVREAAADSLRQIQHRLLIGDLLGQAFMGCHSDRCCCWRRSGWRSPTDCWASSIWRTARC